MKCLHCGKNDHRRGSRHCSVMCFFQDHLKYDNGPRYEGCVEWTGGRNAKSMHGRIRDGSKVWPVHRWVWDFMFGPIPPRAAVVRKCGNPLCVYPGHMALQHDFAARFLKARRETRRRYRKNDE